MLGVHSDNTYYYCSTDVIDLLWKENKVGNFFADRRLSYPPPNGSELFIGAAYFRKSRRCLMGRKNVRTHQPWMTMCSLPISLSFWSASDAFFVLRE